MANRLRTLLASMTERRILLWIILVGVGLRLVAAFILGNSVVELPGIQDQISYDSLARRVVGGFGFSFGTDWWPVTRAGEPTAHWSFLYTLYLAGVYLLTGEQVIVARVLQAIVAGVLTPILTWRVARQVLPSRGALAAAGLSAVYGYFIYYAGALMTESFYILAILWSLDLALRLGAPSGTATSNWRRWALLGFSLGVVALMRQVFLLFVPVLCAWLLWAAVRAHGMPGARRTVVGLMLAGCVTFAMILPWTVRNYQVFHHVVFLNTNAGYAFFWGNHPIHGTNFISILPTETYRALIPQELRPLNEAEIDSALMSRGIGFVLQDPGRYVLLSISRIRDYFMFWPSTDSGALSNVVRVLSYGLYLPLMLYGIWKVAAGATVARLNDDRRRGWILLGLFLVVYTGVHLLTWTLVRYRLPVDAVAMPLAGLAVLDLFGRFVPTRAPASESRAARTGWLAPPVQTTESGRP